MPGLVLQHAARAKFADPRTRQAIGLAFDFEWTNHNLFFDSYARRESFFENSDFVADGRPGPDELALLEPYRDQLPEEVFGEAVCPAEVRRLGPRPQAPAARRSELLGEAGWIAGRQQLVDDEGEPLEVEFLIDASVFERVLSPFVQNLKRSASTPRSARSIRRSISRG